MMPIDHCTHGHDPKQPIVGLINARLHRKQAAEHAARKRRQKGKAP